MRRSFIIGLCLLVECLSAQRWSKEPPTPPHGQKLGPLHSELPVSRFECTGRGGGYYGDMDFGCSVFHYCSPDGTRFTFKCNKGLKFNEITTSCSAGFFGDCTHPEIVGSAGRNMSAKPGPVKSFQNIPVFKGEENSFEDDPRDYPEPFIQHYDPALDLNYEYYEDTPDSEVQDVQPAASNILPSSRHFKKDSNFDTGMRSALSAFASLVNMPLDSTSGAKDRIDRMDHQEPLEYVDEIDRSFLARPPLRRPLIQRENLGPSVKFQGFKNVPKKSIGINRFSGRRKNQIPQDPSSLYPLPPSDQFNNGHDNFDFGPTSSQYQNIIPYDSEDSRVPPESSISQTTPDTFRPSSLLTDNPDDFQPVTTKSDRDLPEHKRPYRQANHEQNHDRFSSGFQSFSPPGRPFSPTRFPSQSSFRGPPSSIGFGGPQSTSFRGPPPSTSFSGPSSSAFRGPPSSTSFGVPPPSSSIRGPPPSTSFGSGPPPSTSFGNGPPPSNSFRNGPPTSFGNGPPPSTSFGGPPPRSFGRPPPQRDFDDEPNRFLPSPNLPSSGNFIFNQPPIHPTIFNTPFNSAPNSPTFGPTFNQPKPQSSSGPTFSLSSGDSISHSINRPGPPTRLPGFGSPPREQTLIRSQNPQGGQTFLDTNSFINNPTRRPLETNGFINNPTQRPLITNSPNTFIRHTTPSSTHVFSGPVVHSTFQPQIIRRPTPAPTGFVTTPQSILDNTNRNPFGFQHERPLLESFPNIVQPTEHPDAGLSTSFPAGLVHQNFPFKNDVNKQPLLPLSGQSTIFPVTPKPNPSGLGFQNLNGGLDVQRTPGSTIRPSGQNNLPVGLDPRPNRRRRPITRRKPSTVAGGNPVTSLNNQPISVTATPQSVSFSKSPPSRTLRKNLGNSGLSSANPLITGLEHSQFNNQFLPQGHNFASQNLDNEDTYTTFDDTQLREPGSQISSEIESSAEFGQTLGSFGGFGTTEKSFGKDSTITETFKDSSINNKQGTGTTTAIPKNIQSSTTSRTPPKTRTPLLRRKPSIRDRIRTRLASRTTTPKPALSEENTVADDKVQSQEVSEINNSPPATTLSPLRQRVRTRLNKLSNQDNPSNDVSEDNSNKDESTTKSSTRLPSLTGQRGINSDRFQRYRNRLRDRLRNRNSRTTVAPSVAEEDIEKSAEDSEDNLGNMETNPIDPAKERSSGTVDETLDSKAVTKDEEAPLQIDDLESDQLTQETSRNIVKEPPPLLDIPLSENIVPIDNFDVEPNPTQVFDDKNDRSSDGNVDTEYDENFDTQDKVAYPAESSNNPEETGESNIPAKRRIINPNFRARFREFLKNRKNRLSASYTTTEAPDVTDATERPGSTKAAPTTAAPRETSTLSVRDRINQFRANRNSIKQRLQANRQNQEGTRLGRRIPLRPSKNNLVDETKKNSDISDEIVENVDPLETREAEINLSENDDDQKSQEQLQKNSVILPLNKVTDGFTPALSPIHVKSPLLGHLPIKEVTIPVKQPEIITAAPPSVFSFEVSASLGNSDSESKNEEDSPVSIDEPAQMMIKEVEVLPETKDGESITIEESAAQTDSQKEEADKSVASPAINSDIEIEDNVPTLDEFHQSEENDFSKPENKEHNIDTDVKEDIPKNILPESREESYLPKVGSDIKDISSGVVFSLPIEDKNIENYSDDTESIQHGETSQNREKSEDISEISQDEDEVFDVEASPKLLNLDTDLDNEEKTNVVTDASKPAKISRPTFNLNLSSKRKTSDEPSHISASDINDDFEPDVTPVPLLPITMATDPPKLPLELLMSFFKRR